MTTGGEIHSARGDSPVGEHPGVVAMRSARFSVLPLLNSSGIDDALLFWRWSPERTVLDVVAAWGEEYAVGVCLPPRRDWTAPFRPTVRDRVRAVSFAEMVTSVQTGSRHLLRPSASDIEADWS